MKNILTFLFLIIGGFMFNKLSAQQELKQEAAKVAEQSQNARAEHATDSAPADSKTTAQDPPAASKQEPKKTEAPKAESKSDAKESSSGTQKMAINEQGVPTKTKPKAKQTTKTDSTTTEPKKK